MSTYCTQAQIEVVYGVNNIAKWADIDNDANATTKANRITAAISYASEEIDDVLRTMGVRIPIVTASGSTPTTIVHIAAVLAGLWLYEGRGAEDYNRDGTIRHGHAWRRDWAYQYLDDLKSGKRAIDGTIGN